MDDMNSFTQSVTLSKLPQILSESKILEFWIPVLVTVVVVPVIFVPLSSPQYFRFYYTILLSTVLLHETLTFYDMSTFDSLIKSCTALTRFHKLLNKDICKGKGKDIEPIILSYP